MFGLLSEGGNKGAGKLEKIWFPRLCWAISGSSKTPTNGSTGDPPVHRVWRSRTAVVANGHNTVGKSGVENTTGYRRSGERLTMEWDYSYNRKR